MMPGPALLPGVVIVACAATANVHVLHVMQEISALQPDLVIGDATASFGHWLTSLTGTPSIEFDVGTSSGLLHSNIFGGQFNPAYTPAASTHSDGHLAAMPYMPAAVCCCLCVCDVGKVALNAGRACTGNLTLSYHSVP